MTNLKKSQDKRLFFCFGPAKSGTTLLQRTLNLHPSVSCPSEHEFTQLYKDLTALFSRYNEILQTVDRRTGGQGATLIETQTVNIVFYSAIEAIARQSARGKSIVGINDNGILHHLEVYDQWFRQPLFIAIFRNPIDQGLSAMHHNLRVAREENDPTHEQLVVSDGGTMEFLRRVAQQFNRDVAAWRAFCAERENVYMLRYEDFVADRKVALHALFSFLGADTADAILDPIVAATDIDQMRMASPNPDFFRRGGSDMGRDELPTDLRRELAGLASEAMEWLGYRVE